MVQRPNPTMPVLRKRRCRGNPVADSLAGLRRDSCKAHILTTTACAAMTSPFRCIPYMIVPPDRSRHHADHHAPSCRLAAISAPRIPGHELPRVGVISHAVLAAQKTNPSAESRTANVRPALRATVVVRIAIRNAQPDQARTTGGCVPVFWAKGTRFRRTVTLAATSSAISARDLRAVGCRFQLTTAAMNSPTRGADVLDRRVIDDVVKSWCGVGRPVHTVRRPFVNGIS